MSKKPVLSSFVNEGGLSGVRIEFGTGLVFLILFTGFLTSFVFLAVQDMHSELNVLDATQVLVRTRGAGHWELMTQWAESQGITFPSDATYRDVLRRYPDRPWLR